MIISKIIAMITAAATALSASVAPAQSSVETLTVSGAQTLAVSGDYTYQISGNNSATITDYNGSASVLEIPATIDGYKVTAIGYDAFYGCDTLTSVTLPEGVTTLDRYAFDYCTSLQKVVLPSTLKTIGNSAFRNCISLKDITIPEGVTTIDRYAFNYCYALTEITVPKSVTTLGSYVFYYCTSLTKATIEANITELAESTFSNCNALTSVTLPDSLETIGEWAFHGCTFLSEVNIPESLTTIMAGAFNRCSSLSAIYYGGTKEKWDAITVGDNNSALSAASLFCTDEVVLAGASDSNILPTDKETPSEGCVFIGVEGYYVEQIQDALDYMNQIRYEACQEGIKDPVTGNPLTPDDYVPIKWSSDLEYIARIRAAESAITLNHKRLNGGSIWFSHNGVSSCAEVLAWNYSASMTDGIGQWYSEKSTWVNGGSGVTGHYTSMIDPRNRYVGLAAFCSNMGAYYNTTAGEFSRSSSLDETRGTGTDTIIQTLEVKASYITKASLKTMLPTSVQMNVSITFDDGSGDTITRNNLPIISGAEYSSSDSDTIDVDSDGKLIVNDCGTATITANLGTAFSVQQDVTINHWYIKTACNPATINEDGLIEYTCALCGDVKSEVLPKLILGDADGNGKVNAGDARMVLKVTAKVATIPDDRLEAVDLNGNGKIDSGDARLILRMTIK